MKQVHEMTMDELIKESDDLLDQLEDRVDFDTFVMINRLATVSEALGECE